MSKVLKPIFKSINMKNVILPALLFLSTSLFAVEPPKFLNGFKYTTTTEVTEDGDEFEMYEINDFEYNRFKKSVLKHKRTGIEIEKNGLMWVYREIEGFDVMSARGFGFKRFYIFLQ
jgi:hypothetical protein